MSPETLLNILRNLECELHSRRTRRDANRLNELLHHSFREFGSSGRAYARSELIGFLTNESQALKIHAEDFRIQSLGADAALLTYRSAEVSADGSLKRHCLRSSVWMLGASGWQLGFHQGTPTEASREKD